ncbi:MAG: TadE/TadG family type IV pilus assembly protein [bacterium]
MKTREKGLFIVEFAIISVALFIVLFAVLELARIIWVWNTANEATRRGARVAAVCPIDHPAIPEATIFATAGSGSASPILRGLTTANVLVSYFDENGNVLCTSDGSCAGTSFGDVRYVRSALRNYTVTPLIPFVNTTFTLPTFETTLPAESLGLIPDPDNPGAPPVCSCFGTATPCEP